MSQGKAAEAEPIHREVVEAQTKLLGPEHPETLVAMVNLADDLIRLHRPDEAVDLALRGAQGFEKAQGAKETHTISAWQIYGLAACLAGNQQQALTVLRRALALRRETDGENGWRTDGSRISLAICLARVHQNDEAETLLLGAAAGLEHTRGPDFLRTQDAYRALRDLYLARGNMDAASRWGAKLRIP